MRSIGMGTGADKREAADTLAQTLAELKKENRALAKENAALRKEKNMSKGDATAKKASERSPEE